MKILKLVTLILIVFSLSLNSFSQDNAVAKQGKSNEDFGKQINSFKKKKLFNVLYDKFSDETVVSLYPITLLSSTDIVYRKINTFNLGIAITFKTNLMSNETKEFILFVKTESKTWKFLESSRMQFLADSTRIDLGESQHKGKIKEIGLILKEIGVSETLAYTITKEELKTLSNSQKVEFRIGDVEKALKPEQLALLKDYLSLFETNQTPEKK